MNLHVISETSTAITLGWDPVAGQEGYVATLDGSEILVDGKRHGSLSRTVTQVRIGKPQDGKPHTYGVEILGVADSASVTSPRPVGGGVGILALGDTLPNVGATLQQAAKLVVVSLDDGTAAAKLPGKSLVYMNSLKILPSGGSGVSWQSANDLGYLTSTIDPDYNANFARIDLPAYQQWFATQAVALARSLGTDGVYVDDVTGYARSSPFSLSAQFAALLQLTGVVGAALRSAGLYLLVNANGYQPGVSPGSDDGSLDLAWWKQVAPHVDGVMTENWQQARDGSNTSRLRGTDDYRKFWDQWQSAASAFAAACPSVDLVGLSYGDDSALTYGRASLMIAAPRGIFLGHRIDDSDPSGSWTANGTPFVDPVAGHATIG